MKKYFLFILFATATFHLFSQTNKSNSKSSPSQNLNKTINVTTADLCDDIDKYKNKSVAFEVFYSKAQNNMWGLRITNRDEERLNSIMNFEIYEENDVYYTRKTIDDCNLVLRIPYNLSTSIPNLSADYIHVTGSVDSKGNIIVSAIKRRSLY